MPPCQGCHSTRACQSSRAMAYPIVKLPKVRPRQLKCAYGLTEATTPVAFGSSRAADCRCDNDGAEKHTWVFTKHDSAGNVAGDCDLCTWTTACFWEKRPDPIHDGIKKKLVSGQLDTKSWQDLDDPQEYKQTDTKTETSWSHLPSPTTHVSPQKKCLGQSTCSRQMASDSCIASIRTLRKRDCEEN